MTTPFLETPRFPDDLAYWARGGVCFSTTIAETTSGREQRNILWKFGRGSWDLQNCFRTGDGVQDAYSVQTLRNFFRIVKGQAYGFRFRDFTDYMDEGQGLLGIQTTFGQDVVPTGAGNGTPTLQLYKKYAAAPLADYRLIAKPLAVQLQRNGATLVAGSSPGNYSLDTTTGLVTFVADNSAAVTGWTPGATTQFTVASVPSGWTVGKMLYFTGVTGTGASAVNGVAVAISAPTDIRRNARSFSERVPQANDLQGSMFQSQTGIGCGGSRDSTASVDGWPRQRRGAKCRIGP
ncbi:DUF2460 domain-containing protein [Burkholderia sp. JKS000303]|uniref:DUF2460 domain-containing protein n=1 Tax=Burkholderia sp. JKS000303 TaxID=1938747 RepID=UPI000BF64973|nr:DUF2460 domain-containing protein [Burkholderia sp. JKS000303]PFH12964.1 uncharacterized protein (TIGR02217 family) [Burkholderia sp. JKS000303]